MNQQLLPTTVSVTTAALIAGLFRQTFKELCLDTGRIALDADRKVLLSSLAAWLGEPVDIEKLMAAERRRDRARRYQRDYRREHA
jgi:hypothetical protein